MDESGDAFHLLRLKKLCRLCGSSGKDSDPPQGKEKYSKIIERACEIDVTSDRPDIHPPGICSSCRLKLQKYKSDKKAKRNPRLSIEFAQFQEHISQQCQVCEKPTDLKDVAKIGQDAGYVISHLPESVSLTKLNRNGTYIMCYAIFTKLGVEKLVVGCRDVTQHHCKTFHTADVQKVLNIMSSWTVCPGNLGFEDVIQSRRKKYEIVTVFRDANKDYAEVAREDGVDTIRHVSCMGFVDLMEADAERCTTCTRYRSVLRSIRSREAKGKQEMHPESHARHDLLDKDKLWQKLKQVQEDRRSLKRQLKSAEQILQTVVQRDSVEIPKDLHKDFKQIILENRDKLQEGSLQQIFWDQQDQCLKRSKQGYRWHPAVIRLCIALHAKSASAYRSLTESGVLTLPSTKTLRDYTYFTSPQSGFHPKIIERIIEDCKLGTLEDFQKNVVLVFDEIHIRQGLVYSAETEELLGWMDMGDINNEIAQLSQEGGEQPLSTQILCFMVRGLFMNLNQVFAYFPSTGYTAHQMYFTAWKAVLFLEEAGFHVRAMTCDGASANRKFFRLHNMGEDVTYYAPHPTRDGEKLYFICDVPHLIKTTRNNWENSEWNSNSKNLEYNNKPISWKQLRKLVEDCHPEMQRGEGSAQNVPILQPLNKIKREHVDLTPSLRMKVKLATQVLSKSVKTAFALNPELCEVTKSTQLFISMMDRFFDCLNVRRQGQDVITRKPELAPYKDKHDWRLQWLMDDFLGFLNDWEQQSKAKPHTTKREQTRLCLSKETMEGLRITVKSFVHVTQELLEEEGVQYVLSAKFNQDPLEQYFSKQRSLGGAVENPDVRRFGYNFLTLMATGSSAIRTTVHGNTMPEDKIEVMSTPMQRR